eukprot:m.240801 g.240801  ORF g.240801 m.240801 type:complete len:58 (-) comp17442_c0_seq3:4915-5088(-)
MVRNKLRCFCPRESMGTTFRGKNIVALSANYKQHTTCEWTPPPSYCTEALIPVPCDA